MTGASRFAAGGLALLAAASFAAPVLAPFDPWALHDAILAPPSWPHLLGTNDLGQDLLSELLYGLRLSLWVGAAAALLSTVVGSLIGVVAGARGGWWDELLMGLTDTLLLIPGLPLLILLIAYLGAGFWNLIVVMGLVWWTPTARAVRAAAAQVRVLPYVEAARAVGVPPGRVILRHVLPNVAPVIAARFVVAVPEAILAEAGLSFLGLGDARYKSLGLTLHHAVAGGALFSGAWWWLLFPVALIALLVGCIAVVGLDLDGPP